MSVKFDLIRVGCKRKDSFKESLLKQNVGFLKDSIIHTIKNNEIEGDCNITIIIPARGFSIKYDISNLENDVKKVLRKELPHFQYKGNMDVLLKNISNPIF